VNVTTGPVLETLWYRKPNTMEMCGTSSRSLQANPQDMCDDGHCRWMW